MAKEDTKQETPVVVENGEPVGEKDTSVVRGNLTVTTK